MKECIFGLSKLFHWACNIIRIPLGQGLTLETNKQIRKFHSTTKLQSLNKKEILFPGMQYTVYTFGVNSVTVSLAGICFNSAGTAETVGFRQ